MDCDVAIVGGGPAGCLTAANLPSSLKTLIFEEHERTGVPTQCAGLVTERVVRSVGAEPREPPAFAAPAVAATE